MHKTTQPCAHALGIVALTCIYAIPQPLEPCISSGKQLSERPPAKLGIHFSVNIKADIQAAFYQEEAMAEA